MRFNFVQGLYSRADRNFLYIKSGSVYAKETSLSAVISHGEWNYFHSFTISGKLVPVKHSDTVILKINSDFTQEYKTISGGTSYGNTFPLAPVYDSIFYHTRENVLYHWDGKKWSVLLAVILGTVDGDSVNCANKGSWFNIQRTVTANEIYFNERNEVKRILTSNGYRFVTIDEEKFSNYHLSFDNDIVTFNQINDIGEYTCISLNNGNVIRTGNRMLNYPVHGLVTSKLGDKLEILTEGFVVNKQWNWSFKKYTKLYVGENGELTTLSSNTHSVQRVGYIYDYDTIYFKPELQILIDAPHEMEVM